MPLYASFVLLITCLVTAPAAEVPNRREIDAALADLSAITGFKIKHPVAFESITRDQVNNFLNARIKDAVKPEEIRAEEMTLRKFGFVPADFDLKKATLDLLTEQTAAFYDFHKKKLFITDWAANKMEDEALIHELAHALADQNFTLEKYTNKVQDDSEQSLARQSVVEGQATWLMRAVLLKRGINPDADETGKGPPKEEEKFPVFDKAPLYFQTTLTFPYDQGEEFQQAVFLKYGKEGFTRVFQRPPVSAQQILHPDLYFSDLKPLDPDVPVIKGMKRFVEGPVGELDHAILLRQYAGEDAAREVSPHWRGGHYRIYENKKQKRDVLVYRSIWTDDDSAQRFFELYEKVLKGKWKTMEVASRSGKRIDGKGDDGYFCVDRNATVVTSREGLAAPCDPQRDQSPDRSDHISK